jgi:hypothetical protein
MMTRSSLLIVTGTQLLLLIGGIQSFVTPFNQGRGGGVAAEGVKNSLKVWSQATDKSTSGSVGGGGGGSSSVGGAVGSEAILDLKTQPRATSVLTELVTNGGSSSAAAAVTEDECSDDISNGKTNGGAASPIVLEEVVSKSSTTSTQQQQSNNVSTATKIIATDDQFIKSLPDKRSYRVITLSNQLTVLLTADTHTDVESASVHVRAGHFDDPVNRAGLAHFHEHVS